MSDSQKWLALAAFIAAGWLLYLLSPILMPFAIAAALAYLGDPLVDRLENLSWRNWRLSRTLAVIVVFLGIILASTLLLLIVVPTIEYQIGEFINKLSFYLQWLNKSVIPVLQKYLGRGIRPLKAEQLIGLVQTHWQVGGTATERLLESVSHSGAVILGWLMNLILIPVITFYLLRDWDHVMTRIHDLFPRRMATTVTELAQESDTVLAAFLRGQFYVMLIMSAVYSIGLWIVGLDLALLIGMVSGLISFVPYLGLIIGLAMACIAAVLQFQDAIHLVWVLLVFGVGHAVEGMWLTPWLVGNKIGLHPVAVIFAILAGGQLFGFLGILLALPVASIVMVLLRHVHDRYTGSGFYSSHTRP